MTTAITVDDAPTMRSDEQVLSALPSAVGCAQRFARYTLEQWQLHGLTEQAEAVVATMVGDAVARTGIVVEHPGYADLYGKTLNLLAVRLRVIGERVLIEVRDDDAAPPWPRDEKEPVAQPGHSTLGARRVGYGLGSTGGTVARFELDISLAGTLDATQALGLPQRIPARLRPVAAPDRSIDVERDPHVLGRVLNGLHQVPSATPHPESSAANLASHQEDS